MRPAFIITTRQEKLKKKQITTINFYIKPNVFFVGRNKIVTKSKQCQTKPKLNNIVCSSLTNTRDQSLMRLGKKQTKKNKDDKVKNILLYLLENK